MKPRIPIAAALVAVCAMSAAQNITATVNGTPVMFSDVHPMMMGSRVMVPLRGVFEQMGADVDWMEATQTVTAKMEDRTVTLRIGDRQANVNGQTVMLDVPAMKHRNRTMVPLRFLGESLGAQVAWIESSQTVAITTTGGAVTEDNPAPMYIEANTVIPLVLNTELSSLNSRVGDRFTATVDTKGASDYLGIPNGTVVEGRVSEARAKTNGAPGVIGVEFDRILMPGHDPMAVDASVVGLDEKSVTNENGRLVAKDTQRGKDTLKWVGYGAGGGVLVALLTKGNVLTDALIGGALGWLFSELQKNPSQSNDVTLKQGTAVGMRLDQRLAIRTR